MAKYKVILSGYRDPSDAGIESFLTKFGQSYEKSPAEARVWIARARNLIYTFDTAEAAEQGRSYLEGLGAVARVDVEEEAPAPMAAAPAAPAAPDGPYPSGPGEYPAPPGAYPYPYTPMPYAPPPTNYLKLWDLGTIIGDAFDILFKNLAAMVVLTLIPMVPGFIFGFVIAFVAILSGAMTGSGGKPGSFAGAGMIVVFTLIMIVIMPVMMYVGAFCQCALTLAAADAVTGRKPDLKDCLKRVDYWLPVKFLVTGLIPGLLTLALMAPSIVFFIIAATQKSTPFAIIGGSMVVLTVPLIFYVISLFMFIQPVTVLENVWLMDAGRRSMELGRGWRLRNLGIFMLFTFIVMIAVMVASLIPCLGSILSMVVQLFAQPLLMIMLVILYYDMRLRQPGGGADMSAPAYAG